MGDVARFSGSEVRGINVPGILTATGWQLPKGMTIEQWTISGTMINRIEGAVQWWLGDWWAYGGHAYGDRVEALEEDGPLADMNFQTLMDYGMVARAFETSRRREVLSFSHHREVAGLTAKQQDKWLDKAERDGLSVMKLRSLLRHAAAIARTKTAEIEAEKLGRFVVLYADPPWRYEHPPMGGSNRSVENHYPTMNLEEICALPIGGIAHEDSIMFMWATSPKLAECFEVIKAWGFDYRTDMVWVKDQIGMGYYVRQRHECLLIARRGEMPPPAPEARHDSVVEAPRLEHSAKPPAFYGIIDRMYPGVRKIELFARPDTNRPTDWYSWGNQVWGGEAVA